MREIKSDCGIASEKVAQVLFDVGYWQSQAYKGDEQFKKRILTLTKGWQPGEDSTSPWRCPNMGSYTEDNEFRYAFLMGVANGTVDLDWFPCGLPVVRNMEHDPRKVDKPEPIIDELLLEALIWAKLGPEPSSGFLCCIKPVESPFTLKEYDAAMLGLFNVKYAIRSGYRAGKHHSKVKAEGP